MKNFMLFLSIALFSASIFAYDIGDFEEFIGYTIIAKKTIEGYYDKDGSGKKQFNGCKYGRIIVFTDNKILKCREYSYSYAYRPKAIILSDGYNIKMLVKNKVYDMKK